MQVKIQTLTPLWTGGANGSMDRIHETGIIGSMRWWYEAIVRGLGGSACDPINNKFNFNAKNYRESSCIDERQRLRDAGLCDVCQVFGGTGWKRRFRVDVEDKTKPIWTQEDRMLNIRPPDRSRGWYLPPGRMGEFILNFSGDGQTLSLLATLFLFLEKWGNIGAKPQLGYGIFEITNRSFVQNFAQHSWHDDMDIYKERADIDQKSSIDLPNLRRFGFLRYNFHPEKGTWWTHAPGLERVATNVQPIVKNFRTAPLAPPLKNEWRFRRWQRWHGGPIDQMLMFGAPQLRWKGETKRVRSKAAVSWAYPVVDGWEMRGWAWLHDQRVASKVWDLLRDESGWQAAIKVPGQMTLYPSGAWNEWTTNGVAEFLDGTKW